MAIPVKLEAFEGPLDLLLHLIEKNKVNIYDIPIVEITEQYMSYVKSMERNDLNVVSEFLVMAAWLLEIKSKMLLPKEVNEEGEEEDPREELVRRLLEYKTYKFMAQELKDLQSEGRYSFYKKPTVPPEVAAYEEPVDLDKLLDGVTLDRLYRVFEMVIQKQKDKVDPIRSRFGQIQKEEVSLSDKMDHVHGYAVRKKRFGFRNLLEENRTKMQTIVTFLAILELMKMGEIRITQEEIFDDILIESLIYEGEEEG